MDEEGGVITYKDLEINIRLEVINKSDKVFQNLNAMHCISFLYNPLFMDKSYDKTFVKVNNSIVPISSIGRSGHPDWDMYLSRDITGKDDLYIARELNCISPTKISGNYCIRESVDGSWTVGMICKKLAYVFVNIEYQCIHADPLLGDLKPGDKAIDNTSIVFHKGSIKSFLKKYEDRLVSQCAY